MILAPIYFIKNKIGQETPPAITHPEYFYGFLGVALSWQVLFLILIERSGAVLRDDPPVHSGKNQLWDCVDCSLVARPDPGFTLAIGSVDWILAFLFLAAYFMTKPGCAAA
jgi:hypothetical protein